MDIKGKIETQDTPEFINSPRGRYDAWKKRDTSLYCVLHPNIHPDNISSIRLLLGSTEKKVGKNIEVTSFRYCRRCFATVMI